MRDSVIKAGPIIVYIGPMGFHRYASEFLSASRCLKADGSFSPVPYYLICRSVELSLKSYLLAKGVAQRELKQKKLGHDLVKVFQRAQSLGLESIVQISPKQQKELAKANDYYVSKGFEYFPIWRVVKGYKGLPELSVLDDLASELIDGLKKLCMDAADGPV